jgi:hypothetical protein
MRVCAPRTKFCGNWQILLAISSLQLVSLALDSRRHACNQVASLAIAWKRLYGYSMVQVDFMSVIHHLSTIQASLKFLHRSHAWDKMISEEKHTCGFNLSQKTKGDITRPQTMTPSPAAGDSARNFDALNILLRSIVSSLRSAQFVARFARNLPALDNCFTKVVIDSLGISLRSNYRSLCQNLSLW